MGHLRKMRSSPERARSQERKPPNSWRTMMRRSQRGSVAGKERREEIPTPTLTVRSQREMVKSQREMERDQRRKRPSSPRRAKKERRLQKKRRSSPRKEARRVESHQRRRLRSQRRDTMENEALGHVFSNEWR